MYRDTMNFKFNQIKKSNQIKLKIGELLLKFRIDKIINKIFNEDNITQVVAIFLLKSRYISDVLRNKLLTKYL